MLTYNNIFYPIHVPMGPARGRSMPRRWSGPAGWLRRGSGLALKTLQRGRGRFCFWSLFCCPTAWSVSDALCLACGGTLPCGLACPCSGSQPECGNQARDPTALTSSQHKLCFALPADALATLRLAFMKGGCGAVLKHKSCNHPVFHAFLCTFLP